MSTETETLKLQLDYSKFVVDIQKTKDKIKELDKAIKELDPKSGARKDLVIIREQEAQKLKDLQKELKNFGKTSDSVSTSSIKSFGRMALMFTGILGLGRGMTELFKKLFKESEAFQKINIAVQEFGVALGGLIDKFLSPFVKGLKSARDIEFEKSLEKIRNSAIENAASFEVLARQVETLGSVLNPTATEQIRYANAVEKLKKEYPEYLSLMSTEISNHKENIGLLETKRKMLRDDIERKVITEEYEVALRNQIKAERELANIKDIDSNEYIEAIRNNIDARNKLSDVESRYNKEIGKTITAELTLANAKATASLKATEKRLKDEEIKTLEEASKETQKLLSLLDKWKEEDEKALEYYIKNQEERLKKGAEVADSLKNEIQEFYFFEERLEGESQSQYMARIAERLRVEEEAAERLKRIKEGILKWTFDTSAKYLDIGDQYNAMETAKIDAKYKEQAKIYKDMLDRNQITKEQYETYILKLDNKAEKEKIKILKRQQKIDYAMTVINTSAGVMSAFKAPDNITMFQKWAQAIAIGVKGALELATIAKQKFSKGIKKFIVPPGYNNDNYPIAVQSGERVTVETKEQQKENDKYAMADPYLRAEASRINQSRGNGVAFTGTKSYLARGGVVASVPGSSTSRTEQLLEAMNRNIASLELQVVLNQRIDTDIPKVTNQITKQQAVMKNNGVNLDSL